MGMDPLGRVLEPEDFLALSKQELQDRQDRLRAGGVELWELVRDTPPHLLGVSEKFLQLARLPPELTAGEFLNGTTEESAMDGSERIALCLTCPPSGGRCKELLHEGEVALWHRDSKLLRWVGCRRWDRYTLDQRMLRWGFPARLLHCTLEDFRTETPAQSEAKQSVLVYLAQFEGGWASYWRGLALYGNVGVGKTHLVVAVCRRLLEKARIRSARFWNVSRLLTALRYQDRDDLKREILESCMECDVLVLDDLCAQKTTKWVAEQIGAIVDHRWSNDLPMLVTSNTALDVAASALGERTASRLEGASLQFDVEGYDHRRGEPEQSTDEETTSGG